MWFGDSIRRIAPAFALVVGCSPTPAPSATDGCVVVAHEYKSCYSDSSSEQVLRPVGETYADDSLVVTRSLVAAAREAAWASSERGRDLFEDLGVTPAELDGAAANIAAAYIEHSGHAPSNAAPDVTALTKMSATLPQIRARLVQQITVGPDSMAARTTRISLPGDPPVTLTNESLSPFYLPWRVVVGEREWTTTDVRLTRALAPLLWPRRSFDACVAHWREQVWRDCSLWAGLDRYAESALSSGLFTSLRGFADAAPHWTVADSTCGRSALHSSETLFLVVRANRARSVDAVHWLVPIVDSRLAKDWNELCRLAEQAESAVAARPWLVQWKAATRDPSIELQAVGASPHDPKSIDERVLQAWRKAELAGTPEFEFLLRSSGEAHATVYLSGADRSGLLFASSRYRASDESIVVASEGHLATDERSYFDAGGKGHALP